jgi:hypothetical protein
MGPRRFRFLDFNPLNHTRLNRRNAAAYLTRPKSVMTPRPNRPLAPSNFGDTYFRLPSAAPFSPNVPPIPHAIRYRLTASGHLGNPTALYDRFRYSSLAALAVRRHALSPYSLHPPVMVCSPMRAVSADWHIFVLLMIKPMVRI